MDISLLSVSGVALIPVTIGIVEAIKRTNMVSDRYTALVSIAVGIGASFVFPGVSIAITVLSGVIIGLSASGLYTGTKSTIG
jgi:hypothetical protein